MPGVTGTDYVKSWAGLLKLGQFFSLLVAFSCLADFSNKSENNGSFKFFLFVTITAWLITMFFFVLFASGYNERISINWNLAMVIYSAIVTCLLLISTSLVAEKAREFRRGIKKIKVQHHSEFKDTCDIYDDDGVPCRNVEAAAVFGFIALALFLADTIFYFLEYRNFRGAADERGFVQQDDTDGIHQDSKPDVEQIP